MELSYLMLTGSLSGLISILAHSIVWSGVELARGATKHAAGLAAVAVSEALLHMLCGIGLGLFFWLSWGLAALVAVPWWVRGLSFAALCWFVLTVPTLLELAFAQRLSRAQRRVDRLALGHDLHHCRSGLCVELGAAL